jgi:hypothetical protein
MRNHVCVNPNSNDEVVDKLISQMEGVVTPIKVVLGSKSGKAGLAPDRQIGRRIYILFKINASGECVKSLNAVSGVRFCDTLHLGKS